MAETKPAPPNTAWPPSATCSPARRRRPRRRRWSSSPSWANAGDAVPDNVVDRGRQATAGLAELGAGDPGLAEVRGLGLMVAAEFRHPQTGAPDTARTAAIQNHCLREGHLILMNAGTYSNV